MAACIELMKLVCLLSKTWRSGWVDSCKRWSRSYDAQSTPRLPRLSGRGSLHPLRHTAQVKLYLHLLARCAELRPIILVLYILQSCQTSGDCTIISVWRCTENFYCFDSSEFVFRISTYKVLFDMSLNVFKHFRELLFVFILVHCLQVSLFMSGARLWSL